MYSFSFNNHFHINSDSLSFNSWLKCLAFHLLDYIYTGITSWFGRFSSCLPAGRCWVSGKQWLYQGFSTENNSLGGDPIAEWFGHIPCGRIYSKAAHPTRAPFAACHSPHALSHICCLSHTLSLSNKDEKEQVPAAAENKVDESSR